MAAGRFEHRPDAPLNMLIVMASTYVAGGDLEYGRYGNPTLTAFEDALGALEGGRCLSFASGLAAVATVLDLVGNDALVVAPQHAYNGTVMQLGDRAARPGCGPSSSTSPTPRRSWPPVDAALVWLESPTNPALEIADIATIREAAHAAGAYVVVDNTFATPLLQKPLEDDVDLVVHSATKYLSGHSDVLMGAVVTRDEELYAVLKAAATCSGPCPAPSRRGWPCAGCVPPPAGRAVAGEREGIGPAVVGTCGGRGGAVPGVRRHRVDVLAQGALAADLLTHKTKLWCTRPRWAGSSRRSSGAAAGGPSR